MTRTLSVHEKEKALTREISATVEAALPDVEVLAVELMSPSRFCVYLDREGGVDIELCATVSGLLRAYNDDYTVDVSSPGLDRPLRTREHFARHVGSPAKVRIDGARSMRGEIEAAGDTTFTIATATGITEIPYEAIVRANLIDEG